MATFITHDSLTAAQHGLLTSLVKLKSVPFKQLEVRQQNASYRLIRLGLAMNKDGKLSITTNGVAVAAGGEVPAPAPRAKRKPVSYVAVFQVGDKRETRDLVAIDRRAARAAAGELAAALASSGGEVLLVSLVPKKK